MTTGGGAGDEFIAGFLDDYFAECEEHLTTIRRALLALEDPTVDAVSQSERLDGLFRSFHTLKGLSAMVDVREAERLAHELESYLRTLRDGEAALDSAALSTLIDCTAALESVIEARRSGAAAPSIEAALQGLSALVPARAGGVPASRLARETLPDRPPVWRFTFVSSPGLVDRGVKVDTIRARLASLGRIDSVSPKVTSGGGIAFEFIVSGNVDPSRIESWRDDGMTWEQLAVDDAAGLTVRPDPSHVVPGPVSDTSILAPSHFVRVDLKRLDDVMRRVADLVVTRARLEDNLARIERLVPPQDWRALQENTLTFDRQMRDLREDVMRVRLVRVDEIFRRMPFVARDVARETGKDVRVVLNGQDTEIDKFLVERMMDPVLHVVRNAVSHGIERPADRAAAGKPPQGTVSLSASTSGEMVLLEIADDGAGIDRASVVQRAREAGVRVSEGLLDAQTLVDLICEPGLSTRSEADRASGRGMGMAVVRTTIRELGGSLAVQTETGRGTRFVISLPLTLAITDALIALVSDHRFAVPQSSVQEVIEIEEHAVRRLERNELVPYRGHSLPLLRLSTLFGVGSARMSRMHAFVIGTGSDAVALAVDRILGQREIVVRTMSDSLLKVDGISGATELGDGRAVLILDAAALARRARHATAGPRGSHARPAAAESQTTTGARP